MKKLLSVAILMLLTVTLVGCAGNSSSSSSTEVSDTKTKIVMGTSSVSKDLAESGKAELEAKGYEVEIKVFDDYVLPNDALVEGSLDANFYQHEPYMTNYNNSNKSDIVMLSPKLYNYYSGLYSTKADTVEDLPEGGKIGIAEDASNLSEQLQQCQEAGLITLLDKPSSGEFYTLADIVDNPKNFQFMSGDGNKYKNMDDYAALIGTSNTMAEAGVDPTQHCLKKFVDNKLAEGICVLGKNKDTKWAKDMMEAYSSSAARANVPASTGFEPAN